MESPIAVAKFFINKLNQGKGNVDSLKVLKLVYIAHGWHLGLSNKPLISEPVEAWQYGPVIRSLYYTLKDINKEGIGIVDNFHIRNRDIYPFLEKIWQLYGNYSGAQLSTMTHTKDTPWYQVYNTDGENAIIQTELIKEHYENKLAQGVHKK